MNSTKYDFGVEVLGSVWTYLIFRSGFHIQSHGALRIPLVKSPITKIRMYATLNNGVRFGLFQELSGDVCERRLRRRQRRRWLNGVGPAAASPSGGRHHAAAVPTAAGLHAVRRHRVRRPTRRRLLQLRGHRFRVVRFAVVERRRPRAQHGEFSRCPGHGARSQTDPGPMGVGVGERRHRSEIDF